MRLSLVIVFFDMAREAPRTLRSASARYQGVDPSLYEVVVVDNGSRPELGEKLVRAYGDHFRYIHVQNALPSPARAINDAVRTCHSDAVGICIDGARMLSPGILRYSLRALDAYAEPVIGTLGFHLGPDVQYRSVSQGYNQAVEDELLQRSGWELDGYRLFGISALAGSSAGGWFVPMAESNCVMLRKTTYERLGGLDERFDLPGGGLVNLDFYKRACELPGTSLVTLLGEGTFHQVHGGISTNVSADENSRRYQEYDRQYQALRGSSFLAPRVEADFIGRPRRDVLESISSSALRALERP